jgi:predicted MFS family arabinose efflux permease
MLSQHILLSMGLLDELIAGFPVVALPLLRDHLDLSYAQVGLLFTIGALSGMVLDPLINLYSDRSSKKPWILWGLLMMAVAFVVLGNVTNFALLALAYAVYYSATGVAVNLAQAVVIDAAPAESTRTMTRWTLLSSIGDFLSPLLVAAFVALNMGWSALCWLSTVILLLVAVLLLPLRFPACATELAEDENLNEVNMWVGLRQALRDPLLLRWSALAIIPSMLDEIFLGFVALYLHDVLHVSQENIALILILQMSASFLGLFVLDRLLKARHPSSTRLLFWLSLATLVGVGGLLTIHVLWLTILMLALISFSCACWYPLAQSEAYACRPGRSGVVRAVISLGTPFEMVLPGAIGLIASTFGVLASIGVLGLAPVLMLVLLPRSKN